MSVAASTVLNGDRAEVLSRVVKSAVDGHGIQTSQISFGVTDTAPASGEVIADVLTRDGSQGKEHPRRQDRRTPNGLQRWFPREATVSRDHSENVRRT